MFQNIRQNSQVFILHKESKPTLEVGMVQSVSAPMPKYPLSPQAMYNPQQDMVVDLIVRVGGQDVTYQKLPANAEVADFGIGGVVITTSREAMNSEVTNLRNKSQDAINSIGYHQEVVVACESILSSLNPELAERQRQQTEIGELKAQIAELKSLLMSGTSKTK